VFTNKTFMLYSKQQLGASVVMAGIQYILINIPFKLDYSNTPHWRLWLSWFR